jgi:Methylase involved in ubiquinone/menaquinone biosynthesis
MTINEARELIASAILPAATHQLWTDLGCGAGIFSYALAGLLPNGSRIICVDKEIQQIKPTYNEITLEFKKADIQEISFLPHSLSGVLMANALHYIQQQQEFVERIYGYLHQHASCIIVEYDTDSPNPWVPYPISFDRLKKLFGKYGEVQKLNERPSLYNRARLYACQVRW